MESEEGFGPWKEDPNGEGIYHFTGWRGFHGSGNGVSTNDLLEVTRHSVGKDEEVLIVRFFGRGQIYRLQDLVGKWRKLAVNFSGRRSK